MLNKPLIALIRVYQVLLSPLKFPTCRFYPTCSEYFIQALRIHGAFKGFALGIWRILRCHPLNRGGYDPIPPEKKKDG